MQQAVLRLEANWEYISSSVEVWYVLVNSFCSMNTVYWDSVDGIRSVSIAVNQERRRIFCADPVRE